MYDKNYTVVVSSLTGNTQKIADAVLEELKTQGINVDIFVNQEIQNLDKIQGDVLIFFWCRKSCMDDLSLSILNKCQNCKILAIGTMGSYVDGDYGNRVRENVRQKIEQRNQCLGIFLSRGKISEKRTEYRMNLPENHPHRLDEEGMKRHISSRNHPNEEDIKNAVLFVKNHIE